MEAIHERIDEREARYAPHGAQRNRRGHRCGSARRRIRRGVGADAGDAEEPGDNQHRRRRRQPCADAGRDRALRQEEPESGRQVQLHQGAGAGTAGQAEGDAGRGSQRHRPRADRHRLPRRRHRAGAADQAPAGIRGQVPEPDDQLSARRGEDAGTRAGPGRRGRVHARRPAGRIQPGQGQAAADDAAGAARLVQGQSEPVDLRAAGQLGAGPHVHHGPAVHPRRQEPEGPGQRLGQDLGVS